jgi:hypothetical protein
VGGYATRNLTGGVAAISNDSRVNNTSNAGAPAVGTKIPGQYIPVNQGFFVSTNPNGSMSSIVGGNIIFKNSQRVFATEAVGSSVFMRSSNKNSSKNRSNQNISNKPIIRLKYDSPTGFHRQIIIGANENASIGYDLGYDALIGDLNEEDMYWTFDDSKFVIQGVNNFNEAQIFPLGLIVKTSGLAVIKVDALENIDLSLTLYIKDNITGETHQINNNPFEIFLETGTYNDRFELVFQANNVLSTNDAELDNNDVTVYYDSESSEIKINIIADTQVLDVALYNILGQRITTIASASRKMSIPVHVNTGVYILQFNTTKGIISKKFIIKR